MTDSHRSSTICLLSGHGRQFRGHHNCNSGETIHIFSCVRVGEVLRRRHGTFDKSCGSGYAASRDPAWESPAGDESLLSKEPII